VIKSGIFPSKGTVANDFTAACKNDPELKRQYDQQSGWDATRKFKSKWAAKEKSRVKEDANQEESFSRVDATLGDWFTFGGLVQEFGGWEYPEAIDGAKNVVAMNGLMGIDWLWLDPQSRMQHYLRMKPQFREIHQNKWSILQKALEAHEAEANEPGDPTAPAAAVANQVEAPLPEAKAASKAKAASGKLPPPIGGGGGGDAGGPDEQTVAGGRGRGSKRTAPPEQARSASPPENKQEPSPPESKDDAAPAEVTSAEALAAAWKTAEVNKKRFGAILHRAGTFTEQVAIEPNKYELLQQSPVYNKYLETKKHAAVFDSFGSDPLIRYACACRISASQQPPCHCLCLCFCLCFCLCLCLCLRLCLCLCRCFCHCICLCLCLCLPLTLPLQL
jgi:hypothetical protein